MVFAAAVRSRLPKLVVFPLHHSMWLLLSLEERGRFSKRKLHAPSKQSHLLPTKRPRSEIGSISRTFTDQIENVVSYLHICVGESGKWHFKIDINEEWYTSIRADVASFVGILVLYTLTVLLTFWCRALTTVSHVSLQSHRWFERTPMSLFVSLSLQCCWQRYRWSRFDIDIHVAFYWYHHSKQRYRRTLGWVCTSSIGFCFDWRARCCLVEHRVDVRLQMRFQVPCVEQLHFFC